MTRQTIRDNQHRIIGYFEHRATGEVYVYSAQHALLGRATRNGTYDAQHRRISPDFVPGLLLPR